MTPKHQTNFDPNNHGFHFKNSFPFIGLVEFGPYIIDLSTIGLCGGMCLAALDFAYKRKPIPGAIRAPENGPLYDYLFRRQIDSWHPPYFTIIKQIIEWQMSPNTGVVGDIYSLRFRTRNGWSLIKSSLDAGFPITLMLIRDKGPVPSKNNHQVLAIGYKLGTSSNKRVIIYVYNPNSPNATEEIRFNLATKYLAPRDSTGARLRGFFAVPYDREPTTIVTGNLVSSWLVPVISVL